MVTDLVSRFGDFEHIHFRGATTDRFGLTPTQFFSDAKKSKQKTLAPAWALRCATGHTIKIKSQINSRSKAEPEPELAMAEGGRAGF